MTRAKVTEELAAEWDQLHQKGQSFRSIARENSVDPRTVQAWVRRAGDAKRKEHWEAVSRQVDSRYLDEHFRLISRVAAALLDVVHADPIGGREPDAEKLLRNRMSSVAREAVDILKGRGLNLDPLPDGVVDAAVRVREETVARVSRKLVDALMGHEPGMKASIDGWKGCWGRYQKARQELAEACKGLFTQRGVPDGIADDLMWGLVREALGVELFGQEPGSCSVERRGEQRVVLVRRWSNTEQDLCDGSARDMETCRKAYDLVLEQVRHPERIRTMLNAYRHLQDRVREVEDSVDRLVLTGVPQSQCTLCPNYLTHSSPRPRTKRASQE